MKLVSGPGGEAIANTAFTILTPGGDVIREMIGAFPSLVLAEGQYVAIARHDGKTYQTNFEVVSGADRDVEVHADPEAPQRSWWCSQSRSANLQSRPIRHRVRGLATRAFRSDRIESSSRSR